MFNLHLHKWSKWEKYYDRYKFMAGILASKESMGKVFDGKDLRQRRHCVKCNKTQDELIESMI